MYQDKLVVAIKVAGRILRESGDTVSLPFGSEYSLLLKNMNSVRTQVSVSIDGEDVMGGSRLILQPNSAFDLERFMRSNNMEAGNRFKFIERTAAVEQHRGVGAEDGLIRVEAWREEVALPTFGSPPYRPIVKRYVRPPGIPRHSGPSGSGPLRGMGMRSFASYNYNVTAAACNVGASEPERGDAGITVSGSQSNQQFYSVMGFPIEAHSAVIVLRIRGAIAGAAVVGPVTVDVRPECQTCGKVGAANDEFCARCGTSLVVIA